MHLAFYGGLSHPCSGEFRRPAPPSVTPLPTTIDSVRLNRKCWKAHNWAEDHSLTTTGVQCYLLNNLISHW